MRDMSYKEMAFIMRTFLMMDRSLLSETEKICFKRVVSLLEVLGRLEEDEENEEEE